MIINVRGTSGSGKSTLVRGLMSLAKVTQLYGVLGPRFAECQKLEFNPKLKIKKPLYVIGPYHSPAGGCDRVQPFELNLRLFDKYVVKGHLMFEGLLLSEAYGRVGEWLSKHKAEAVIGFMDTPLEVCLRQIGNRRNERQDGRRLNPHNTTRRVKGIARTRQRFEQEGFNVIDLSMKTGVETIVGMLRDRDN